VTEHSTRRGNALAGAFATVVTLVAFAFLAWWGIASRARALTTLERDTAEMATPSVTVVRPKPGTPQEEVVLPGSLQAYAEAPIYARTSGYLKRRLVDIGSRVRALCADEAWQEDLERRAHPELAGEADVPSALLHDPVDGREP